MEGLEDSRDDILAYNSDSETPCSRARIEQLAQRYKNGKDLFIQSAFFKKPVVDSPWRNMHVCLPHAKIAKLHRNVRAKRSTPQEQQRMAMEMQIGNFEPDSLSEQLFIHPGPSRSARRSVLRDDYKKPNRSSSHSSATQQKSNKDCHGETLSSSCQDHPSNWEDGAAVNAEELITINSGIDGLGEQSSLTLPKPISLPSPSLSAMEDIRDQPPKAQIVPLEESSASSQSHPHCVGTLDQDKDGLPVTRVEHKHDHVVTRLKNVTHEKKGVLSPSHALESSFVEGSGHDPARRSNTKEISPLRQLPVTGAAPPCAVPDLEKTREVKENALQGPAQVSPSASQCTPDHLLPDWAEDRALTGSQGSTAHVVILECRSTRSEDAPTLTGGLPRAASPNTAQRPIGSLPVNHISADVVVPLSALRFSSPTTKAQSWTAASPLLFSPDSPGLARDRHLDQSLNFVDQYLNSTVWNVETEAERLMPG